MSRECIYNIWSVRFKIVGIDQYQVKMKILCNYMSFYLSDTSLCNNNFKKTLSNLIYSFKKIFSVIIIINLKYKVTIDIIADILWTLYFNSDWIYFNMFFKIKNEFLFVYKSWIKYFWIILKKNVILLISWYTSMIPKHTIVIELTLDM